MHPFGAPGRAASVPPGVRPCRPAPYAAGVRSASADDTPPPAISPHREAPLRLNASRAAAVASLGEALVLLALALFYAYETASGAAADVARAVTSGVLILVFAVLLLVVARGWSRGADWPRTPTLLWNALLLPVAWSLHDAGRTLLAVGVAGVALGSIVAALAAPASAPVRDRGVS